MKCQKSKIFEHIRKKQSFFQMKGQITVFIVLGIVVMVIFGLVFFISGRTSDILLEKKINKIYSDFLSSTNIKNVAQNCLDKTAREALLLIGLQGGMIYGYQIDKGYNIPLFYDVIPFNYTGDRDNHNGTIYNVSYGIKAPTNLPYLNPPNYPYPDSLVGDISMSGLDASFYSNPANHVFASVPTTGRSNILTDLCNKLGPNDPYIEKAGISCETYSIKNESIQGYAQQYIEENVEDCINITLEKTTQYNVSSGKLSSQVLIGKEDLLISLVYPIEISLKNKPPITKYLDFNVRPNVRLKILHEIASHLIGYNEYVVPTKADSNNIFFNTEKDDPNDCYDGKSSCLINGIKVFKLRDYCLNNNHCNFGDRHYNYSDIVVIEDNKSIIDGKPYRFQFAVENRRPALDFIDENVSSDKYYYWYINATYGKNLSEVYNNITGHQVSDEYNIVVKSPYIFNLFPLGLDPDEDNLVYNYTNLGWSSVTITLQPPKDALVQVGGTSTGDFVIRINVSDNEGLYDYQDVIINVTA